MKKEMNNIVTKLSLTIVLTLTLVFRINYYNGMYNFQSINFPQMAGDLNNNLTIDDVSIDLEKIENRDLLKSGYIVDETISDSKKETIKKAFDLENIKVNKIESKEIYSNDTAELLIYDNGSYLYKVKGDSSNETVVNLTDDECKDKAINYLKENDLLPDDFDYDAVGYETVAPVEDPENKQTVKKIVFLKRKLNGVDVKGTSKIFVSIAGDGEVNTVYGSHGDIRETGKPTEIIPASEAVNKAKKLEGLISVSEEADNVKLENIEVVYWEDSAPGSENSTIQPVYKITGQAFKGNDEIGEFTAIESAIK